MATTLQPWLPRAPKKAPDTPMCRPRPSPTTLTTAWPGCASRGSMSPAASSAANMSARASRAAAPSCSRTQMVMLHSLEPWVMSTMFTPRRARAEKARAASPSTPRSPDPEMSSRARPGSRVRPRGAAFTSMAPADTRVPGWSGRRVLRTRVGMAGPRT